MSDRKPNSATRNLSNGDSSRSAEPVYIEFGLLALLALLWGSSYLLIKIAVAEIPPLTLIAVRVVIASVVLCAVVHFQRERFPRDAATWRQLFVQAFLSSIGAWTVLAWGQQFIDSSMASVLNSTSPIFVVLITVIWTRHEVVNLRRLSGVTLGIVGVVLIVGIDVLRGLGDQVAGQLAALTGALMYAAAAIYGKRFSSLPVSVTSAATMIWSVVVLVPASLLVDRPWTLVPSAGAIVAALSLGLFCTALALLIYFRLLKTLGSVGTTSQSYLRAGVGVALGVLLLGEKITAVIFAGLVCAILGVLLINFPQRKR